MERQDKLTNEVLGKKFSSQFDLVNYAIHVAKQMIKSGREARVEADVKNRAQLILEEIAEDKIVLQDLEFEDDEDEDEDFYIPETKVAAFIDESD